MKPATTICTAKCGLSLRVLLVYLKGDLGFLTCHSGTTRHLKWSASYPEVSFYTTGLWI
ncbi:hypothetical protein PF008_g3179 [Phytophthora fragariae]|uniref:Uncharacterized protein n=1 Tax=Phytophthora fragariae TaxID=53985 RepID=A0A6G0SGY2_9STRA|nr:hypothetical protein PF008_g3179 [Phytophthora fragariae]